MLSARYPADLQAKRGFGIHGGISSHLRAAAGCEGADRFSRRTDLIDKANGMEPDIRPTTSG